MQTAAAPSMIGRAPNRSTRGPSRNPMNINSSWPIESAAKNCVRVQPNSSTISGAKTAATEVWTPTATNCAMNAAATMIQP